MDDAGRVGVVEGIGHRAQDGPGLLGLDPSTFPDELLQRLPLEHLHHEMVLAHVEDPDDVGVGQRAGGLRLPAKALQVLLCLIASQVLGLDRLDCNETLDDRVASLVDSAHRPVTNLGDDLVSSEPLRLHGCAVLRAGGGRP